MGASMDCGVCGAANPPDGRYCDTCGASFTVTCPVCGTAITGNARFCDQCGATLGSHPGANATLPQDLPAVGSGMDEPPIPSAVAPAGRQGKRRIAAVPAVAAALVLVVAGVATVAATAGNDGNDRNNGTDAGGPEATTTIGPPATAPTAPFGYGDDPLLDDLWDRCAAAATACRVLAAEAPAGSAYEAFASSCGNQPSLVFPECRPGAPQPPTTEPPDPPEPPAPALPYEEVFAGWAREIEAYWQEALPATLGTEWFPLEGGYVNVRAGEAVKCRDGEHVWIGWYCAFSERGADWPQDMIVTDDDHQRRAMSIAGSAAVGAYLAHEWGHAVSYRAGTQSVEDRDGIEVRTGAGAKGVFSELLAECFAGAFIGHYEADGGVHLQVTDEELERGTSWYYSAGDEDGYAWDLPGVHGPAELRAEYFQLGREGGPAACRVSLERDDPFLVYLDVGWWESSSAPSTVTFHVDLFAPSHAGQAIDVAVFFVDRDRNPYFAAPGSAHADEEGRLVTFTQVIPETDGDISDIQLPLPASELGHLQYLEIFPEVHVSIEGDLQARQRLTRFCVPSGCVLPPNQY